MKNSNLFIAGMLLVVIIVSGYQCSSTELTSAKLYYDQKNYDKAIEMLQAEVKKNPKSDEGYYWLGRVYEAKGVLDSMVMAFNSSLEISDKFKNDIDYQRAFEWQESYNRGISLFNRGRNTTNTDSSIMYQDLAIEAYKDAIMLEPDTADTYKNLAFAYLLAQRNEEAIEPLQKIIELDQAEEGYEYLGQVYYALGANKMIDYRTTKNSVDSIYAMELFDKSISTLEEGLEKYPDNTEMQLTITTAYIEADKIDIAISSAEKLVEKDPLNKAYRYNYGVLLLNVEKYAEAETQLLKAIEIDPDYENAIYNLGVTYVKWGTAINKDAEKQGLITEDYKKKYEAALPYLEKVVEVDPTNIAIWELLGKVYSVLGMNDDANNAFKKADELR
ncbi:MAG: tetratricopeptide repeat protein [Ignavibacteriaceae bacterium]|jgi:tetratricopeptide (TPR) repeat protein|nr:tetratricopeptide repeat protein [Ignavibacteriaceae bacterium]